MRALEAPCEDMETEFGRVGDDRRWAAVARVDGIQIYLSVENVAPADVRLVRLRGLGSYAGG
jgi:hypothetical protein